MRYNKNDILLFACIEKNIGDDLFIQTVCNRYPERNFIISSSAMYGDLKKIKNLKFSKELKWWIIFDSVSKKKRIKFLIASILKTILKLILRKHDLGVYIVGNAFKNMDYKDNNQLQWFENRVNLSKEFYLISTNFGPFNDERWLYDAKQKFLEANDICFRDLQSYDFFSDLPNTRYAPDAILSLGKQKHNTKRMLVLISVIDCSFYAREEWLKKQVNNYEKKIIDIIQEFDRRGYRIILINSNTEQDGPSSKRIFEKCKLPSVSIFNYEGNLDELKSLYEKAMYVIGTRLHTIILAWLYNLPVYPLVYDVKVENMLKSYSYKGNYTNIEEISQLNVSTVVDTLEFGACGIDDNIIAEANMQFLALDERVGYLK